MAQPGGAGPAMLLAIARRCADAARARGDLMPSYETMGWLVGLARRPGFADRATGAPRAPEALALSLAQLQRAADGPVADLLLGAMRSFPLDPVVEHPGIHRLFLGLLALLLDPTPPSEAAVADLLEGFEAADGALEGLEAEGLGLRFLVLAACLALGIRTGAPAALRARQLHALGRLAGLGAGAMLHALDEAEQQEERIRAALSDPAFAMRVHARVPTRAMAVDDAQRVRKDFGRQDALAEQARAWMGQAEAAVASVRADIAVLRSMEEALQAQAGLMLSACG